MNADEENKRLDDYLRRLRFVHSYGGCVIDERDRPKHRGCGPAKVQRKRRKK